MVTLMDNDIRQRGPRAIPYEFYVLLTVHVDTFVQ